MAMKLDDIRKAEALRALQQAYKSVIEEDLSDFRAEAFLDAVLKAIGPTVYNPVSYTHLTLPTKA